MNDYMNSILRLEEAALLIGSFFLFGMLPYALWWFPVFILGPDLSMIGYVGGARWGAFTYNLVHTRLSGVLFLCIGFVFGMPILILIGSILAAHTALDRLLGYGLKYGDSFQHTHLSCIGSK
ncbi:MAG: DUF4260 domain-containing protein [Candidatus Paceibacteria bacterium]